ncbi:Proteophosphoglycan ppg4 [Rhodotorula diobovata]|uniref:Proteophosphoglycan ppg4 n=1 Tax=Rhodotorula diobovata TaxID=5288 RepID=A0A5C5FSW2_9BASI|nr:Proteophosphoglycan ppg4 [Rhodotorula diobovata]
MPLQLANLPPELLPQLLAPLVSRRDLCSASRVCRAWRPVAQRLLFRHIRLFGRDLAIASHLFTTLADYPDLAALVRRLEVRVYPLSMKLRERLDMEQLAVRMLANCTGVQELVWTRKGALTDAVFDAIKKLPNLHSFEINAHTTLSPGSWDADHFLDLPPLRSLSLILPDRNVANVLPAFLDRQRALAPQATFRTGEDQGVLLLEELSILCRESPVINDALFSSLLPSLAHSRLTSLALAGCAKLSGSPLLDLLPSLPHLRHLALEACALDSSTFFPHAAPHLSSLESLKLTHPGPRHPSHAAFLPALETLLDHTHALTSLTLYHSGASATGSREWPSLPADFVRHVASVRGARLRKFEVSGVLVGLEAVEALTERARGLRNVVLHLGYEFDLSRLTAAFAPLASLRTLHLLSQRADISPDDVLSLAEQCSPTLRQIGFRNRVWLVKRSYAPHPDPDLSPDPDVARAKSRAKVSLAPYDLPWFPEALLVVRT